MKKCSGCKIDKPLDCFYKNRSSSDGYNSYCRVCWREVIKKNISKNPERRKEIKRASAKRVWARNPELQRAKWRELSKNNYNGRKETERKSNIKRKKHYAEMKQDAINLLGGKCINCGYNKSNHALEFHHKNPKDKEYAIGSRMAFISSNSKSSYLDVIDELNKCILLCKNCHAELHESN